MEWFRAPPNANRKVELYIIKCNIIPYCNFPYSFYFFPFFHFFNIFMLFLPFAHYIFHAIQSLSRSRFNCWRKCSVCWCWVNEQVTLFFIGILGPCRKPSANEWIVERSTLFTGRNKQRKLLICWFDADKYMEKLGKEGKNVEKSNFEKIPNVVSAATNLEYGYSVKEWSNGKVKCMKKKKKSKGEGLI